ncbi:hypothetical protein Poly51_10230 [Rubripirellula tenax]|uniref:Methyltransferase n=1 Tax=Rubripirellula tenax TaxID=2528015 RepID=A0A5C6FML2_9BACT|nr:hypothetical protein [Rubripirellula tenax]TWU60742.1 hypothetical protein Poly51_10230 [Rubripirellula tenax]
MAWQPIPIPASIKQTPIRAEAEHLIDVANDAIEAFWLNSDAEFEHFVACDFHLLDQAITWIVQNDLMAGNRFCELGSGFGVGAMLATIHGMEAIGIEIEPILVEQSVRLASELGSAAKFHCGSYIPQGMKDTAGNINQGADIYEQIGIPLTGMHFIFAYPWPEERAAFDALMESLTAKGTLLMTYQGRTGMRLVRNE